MEDEKLYRYYIRAYLQYAKGTPQNITIGSKKLTDRQLAAIALGLHEAVDKETPDMPNEWEEKNPIDDIEDFYNNDPSDDGAEFGPYSD